MMVVVMRRSGPFIFQLWRIYRMVDGFIVGSVIVRIIIIIIIVIIIIIIIIIIIAIGICYAIVQYCCSGSKVTLEVVVDVTTSNLISAVEFLN